MPARPPVASQPAGLTAWTSTPGPAAAKGSQSVNAPAPSVVVESHAPPAHAGEASRTRANATPASPPCAEPSFAVPPPAPSSRNTVPSTRLPCHRPKSTPATSVELTAIPARTPVGFSVPIQPAG